MKVILRLLPIFFWILALALGGWVLSQLPLHTISQTLDALDSLDWVTWLALNLIIILLLTVRWQLITTLLNSTTNFWQLLFIKQAGQTVNFITPGPQFGGEPLQVFWLYKNAGMPLNKAILSLVLDRFYELWINFFILLLSITLLLLSPVANFANWKIIAFILVLLWTVVSFTAWVAFKQPQQITAYLKKLTIRWQEQSRFQSLKQHWKTTTDELKHVAQQGKLPLVLAVLLSLAAWCGLLAELALMMKFVDIPVTLANFFLILVTMRLALLLPIPGGIGTLEAAIFWSFQALNLPSDAAIGLIALMRLRDAAILIFGLACLSHVQFGKAKTFTE